mmetsp:Transcript_7630/g.15672  ORF Transcript_7630/g.15672 Transcript_7630/m.15672 type:complete len:363 (+) Transcript_7630:4914-6002(+)
MFETWPRPLSNGTCEALLLGNNSWNIRRQSNYKKSGEGTGPQKTIGTSWDRPFKFKPLLVAGSSTLAITNRYCLPRQFNDLSVATLLERSWLAESLSSSLSTKSTRNLLRARWSENLPSHSKMKRRNGPRWWQIAKGLTVRLVSSKNSFEWSRRKLTVLCEQKRRSVDTKQKTSVAGKRPLRKMISSRMFGIALAQETRVNPGHLLKLEAPHVEREHLLAMPLQRARFARMIKLSSAQGANLKIQTKALALYPTGRIPTHKFLLECPNRARDFPRRRNMMTLLLKQLGWTPLLPFQKARRHPNPKRSGTEYLQSTQILYPTLRGRRHNRAELAAAEAVVCRIAEVEACPSSAEPPVMMTLVS